MNESVISFYAVQSNNPTVNNVQSLMKNNVAFNGIMYLERDLQSVMPLFYSQSEIRQKYSDDKNILPLKGNFKLIPFFLCEKNKEMISFINGSSTIKERTLHFGSKVPEFDCYQLLGYFAVSREHFSENTLEILELAKNVLLREFKLKSLDRV